MRPLPWFRLYSEAVDDPKMRLLAFEDRWHFIAILCCKCQGLLDKHNEGMARRMIAVKLGLDSRELDEVSRRLAEVGLIDPDTLNPLAWDVRQFKSDSSAARVRKYRKKKRKKERNKDVTLPKRKSNALDTDTDTDTEKEQKPPRETARNDFWKQEGLTEEFSNFKKMRRQIKAPLNALAETRLIAKLERLKEAGHDIAEALNRSTENCWKGVYEPKNETSRRGRDGNGRGPVYGETPADRNREASERYFRERSGEAVAAND